MGARAVGATGLTVKGRPPELVAANGWSALRSRLWRLDATAHVPVAAGRVTSGASTENNGAQAAFRSTRYDGSVPTGTRSTCWAS